MKNKKFNLEKSIKKLKEIDFKAIIDSLQSFQVEDLKNLDYKRLFYDIKNSKYIKPVGGIFAASILSIIILIPKIQEFNSSLKKVREYSYEKNNLELRKADLKKLEKKLRLITLISSQINSSFLKNENSIFISGLVNDVAKNSNVKVDSFSPILKADSSKLCKNSLNQSASGNFIRNRKSKNSKKGNLQSKFYELLITSDYLDLIEFLKQIQLYEVNIIPFCLEVDSQITLDQSIVNSFNDKKSLIIPLLKNQDSANQTYNKQNYLSDSNLMNSKVSSRIVIKIPTFID